MEVGDGLRGYICNYSHFINSTICQTLLRFLWKSSPCSTSSLRSTTSAGLSDSPSEAILGSLFGTRGAKSPDTHYNDEESGVIRERRFWVSKDLQYSIQNNSKLPGLSPDLSLNQTMEPYYTVISATRRSNDSSVPIDDKYYRNLWMQGIKNSWKVAPTKVSDV